MRTIFIAVTGGIGSGKSTACKIISKMGYLVISADDTYAELLKDPSFTSELKELLDLPKDKEFDKKSLAKTVFDQPLKLKLLNQFTHKKIMDKMFEKSKGKRVVFHEVPLLFESGYEDKYDEVLIIKRDLNDRINSVISRSGLSREEVEKRIKNQFDYENLSSIKHTVIINGEDLESFANKVRAVVDEKLG